MKKIKTTLVVTFYLLLSTFNLSAQNVGINSTGATPDSSALLDLSSSNKGFLITRVDTANIPSPAFGLMTLAPSDSCLYMFNGTTWTGVGGVGSNCSISGFTPPPTFPCGPDVTNSTTGKTWMACNLGASQVATSSTDSLAYGDLYQWGRYSDGHEKRTSGITTTQSTTDTPRHGDFIINSVTPVDWRNPQNDSLWQGVNGTNNPCPSGYRLPTKVEWDFEIASWSPKNATGAINSVLKLPMAGSRYGSGGSLFNVGAFGYYWSSTVSGTLSRRLTFSSSSASLYIFGRANGLSVRCIKD